MSNLLKRLFFLVLVLLIPACSGMRKRVPENEHLKKTLLEDEVRSAIFFDSEGNIVVADTDGKRLPPCSIKPGKNQCRALERGAEVLDVRTVTVIKSKTNPNCVVFVDGRGFAYQICW